MKKLAIDSLVIVQQRDSIYFIAREVALQAHSQQAYIHYLTFYRNSPWANDIREKLHAEAFLSIQPGKSPAEMDVFLKCNIQTVSRRKKAGGCLMPGCTIR